MAPEVLKPLTRGALSQTIEQRPKLWHLAQLPLHAPQHTPAIVTPQCIRWREIAKRSQIVARCTICHERGTNTGYQY